MEALIDEAFSEGQDMVEVVAILSNINYNVNLLVPSWKANKGKSRLFLRKQ